MRVIAVAVSAGSIGTFAVLAAALAHPEHALAAWLMAMLVVSMAPTGALALLFVWHLHRGSWGVTLGPAMTAAVDTMPLVGLGMLPILVFAGTLYPWAGNTGEQVSPWLTQPAFGLRGLVYLALWWVLAHLAARAGVPTETTAPRPGLASAGLIVYALTASLAGIDWVLALQPKVFSSIFGLIFITHQMFGAFAFLALVSLWTRSRRCDPRGIGNMLLGAVMLWMYHEYMQYLIVWSGDLPGHIEFYLARSGGLWTAAIWLMAIAGGAVPFVLLLWSRVRSSVAALSALALVLLICRILEAAWWVLPVARPDAILFAVSAAALTGAGGLWLAGWRWRLTANLMRKAHAHG